MNRQEKIDFVSNFLELIFTLYQKAQNDNNIIQLCQRHATPIYDRPLRNNNPRQKQRGQDAFHEQEGAFTRLDLTLNNRNFQVEALISGDSYVVVSIQNIINNENQYPLNISYLAMKVVERDLNNNNNNNNNNNRINRLYKFKLTGLNYDAVRGYTSGISAESILRFLINSQFPFPQSFLFQQDRVVEQQCDRDTRGKIRIINEQFLNILKQSELCTTKGATNENSRYEEYKEDETSYEFYGGQGRSYEMYFLLFNKLETPQDIEANIQEYIKILKRSLGISAPELAVNTLYVERHPLEEEALTAIQRDCSLLKIQGTKGMGKTLFKNYLLQRLAPNDYEVITYNFNDLTQEIITDNSNRKLFKDIVKVLFKELLDKNYNMAMNIDEQLKLFENKNETPTALTKMFFQSWLSNINRNLVIVFENADSAFLLENFRLDFSNFIRVLTETLRNITPAHPERRLAWSRLRLILVNSTDVYALEENINNSPLANVGYSVIMRDFTKSESQLFFQRRGINLQTIPLEQIFQLIGGHPYLLQIICDNLLNNNIETILEQAPTQGGVYQRHFIYLENFLNKPNNIRSRACFAQVIQSDEPVQLSSILDSFKLQSIGLIKKYDQDPDKVIVANNLYQQYFKSNLKPKEESQVSK